MKRIASSLVFATVLVAALTASLAWTGHAVAQTEETEPGPDVTFSLDVTIETADGVAITLPLQLDDEAFAVLGQLAPADVLMQAMAELTGRELMTITVSSPTVITPFMSMLVVQPVDAPAPPIGASLVATATEPTTETDGIATDGIATDIVTDTATTSDVATETVGVDVPPVEEAEPTIVNSVANLRTGPTTDADAIGQLAADTVITLTGRNSDGSWFQIDDGSWIVSFVVENAPEGLPIVLDGVTSIRETVPATVTGDAVVLRAGPSVNDESLGPYEGGTVTAVISRAPDGEWLEVLTPDGSVGWMSSAFLEVADALEALPTVISSVSSAITGRVVDSAGEGIGDIVVAAMQSGDQAVSRVEGTTSSDGEFSLYVTPGEETEWSVSIEGVGCNSRIVNDRCQLFGYFASTPEAQLTLPSEEPVTLIYEDASSFIAGTVLGADGEPAGSNIRVMGTRDDGARTAGMTSSTGKFVLPAARGSWTIFTESGPELDVEVPEKSAPEPVDLPLE